MDDLTMTALRDVVAQQFGEMGTRIMAFLPQILAAALILLVGWGVATASGAVVRRGLRTLRVDRLAYRHRVAEHVGLAQAPSEALGRLVYWLVLITFLLSSIQMLGVTALSAMLDRLLGFIPNLVGAALVGVLGVLLARFLGSMTASAAAAAGVPSAARLGFSVQLLAIGLVALVAIEQLGFATSILVGPLLVLAATIGLTAGLAFALGARPIITHILAGHFLKQTLPRDAFVEIDGQQGVVERIGATDTLFRNGERRWSVPNAQLLDQIVLR